MRRSVRRAATLAWVAALLAGFGATACTSSPTAPVRPIRSLSGSPAPSSRGVGGAGDAEPAACRPVPTGDQPDLLTLRDVWHSDNGGRATTVTDLRPCAGASFDATDFVCRLPFPWLSTANTASQLSALGADQVRVSRLVGPTGVDVTETLVTFGVAARAGTDALKRQAAACGGTTTERGSGEVIEGGAGEMTWAVRVSASSALAMTFEGTSLTHHEQETLLRRAAAKTASARS